MSDCSLKVLQTIFPGLDWRGHLGRLGYLPQVEVGGDGLTLEELSIVLSSASIYESYEVSTIYLNGSINQGWHDLYTELIYGAETNLRLVNYFEADLTGADEDADGHWAILEPKRFSSEVWVLNPGYPAGFESVSYPLRLLYNSMRSIDDTSGRARGYIVLRRLTGELDEC